MTEQFDSRPQAVDRWLKNLPIAHVGETARQLYMAMRSANRQDGIPVKHHFHMLEGIAEPLSLILPELHKHYVGKPLPLTNKQRKIADLYTQLLRQSILGYQQVIAHAIELNRFGWKRVVTTSVHRIFHYCSFLLCNYRLLYQPYPKGQWQQTYWLYQLVEKYKLLNSKVASVDGRAHKTTLLAEFKKLLLHSLLSPNLFKPEELQQVVSNMDLWNEDVSLLKGLRSEAEQIYAFTLDTDLPPGLIPASMNHAQNPAIEVRYLDISPLLHNLNRVLTRTRSGVEDIKLARRRFISRRALFLLLNNWGRPASRDGERRLIQGQAEVAIGISAIHYIISEGRQPQISPAQPAAATPARRDSAFSLSTQLHMSTSELNALGFATEREQNVDVWESVYFEPEAQPPSWTESIRMKVYSYLNAKVLNISKGGFCIALPQDGVEHIQTNELVAIRGKKGEWQLGEIRWLLCPANAPIRAGIQKHSQTVVPTQLHIQINSRQTQPIKCLLGENEKGQLLFLPNIPFALHDKKIVMECNGEMKTVELVEQVYTTPVGSAHYIKMQATHAAADSNTSTASGYDTIWASL